MKIAKEVLTILSRGLIDGNSFTLKCGQLDRKLYLQVNDVLENLGGKWDRKAKAHIFENDPSEMMDNVILTGEAISIKKNMQFFETPKKVVEQMMGYAMVEEEDVLLEPSAGKGAILDFFPKENKTICIEKFEVNAKILREKGYSPLVMDFMDYTGVVNKGSTRPDVRFDKIIMNPPFTKQQDIDHVLHAYSFLATGGTLVSVMSSGFRFRENNKSVSFREFIGREGVVVELPSGAFKESGTLVNSVLVVIERRP